MSKIYEALLRAEIERTAAKNAEDERTRPLAGDAGTPEEAVKVEPEAPAVPPNGLPALADTLRRSTPSPAAEPVAAAAWLDGVRAVPWQPRWDQLLALENRGGTLEQFRTLRSRIQEFRSLNTLKTILVSSGRPQEGKSFVSINLAVSLARHKSARVLLIDGDMRKSSLQSVLGTEAEPGLTEYLSGQASIAEVLQRGVSAEGGPALPRGLSSLLFLPAGSDADNAADLSGNNRFGELIAAVAPHVDWIVIDSSPVNLVTDAVNLARAADAVLLVARGAVTTFQSARRAMSEFKSSRMLGVVLNAVQNLPKTEGYYGAQYGQESQDSGPASREGEKG